MRTPFWARLIERPPEALKSLGLLLLSVLAALSIEHGFQNALTHSQDMQWSPLIVFWRDNLDPYQEFLKNPHSAMFILDQAPNNLHFSNFILAPLGFMDFSTAKAVWATANVASLVLISWTLHRLPGVQLPLVFLLIFLCSTPSRNAIGNGQLSIFCLLWYTLYLKFTPTRPMLAAMFASIGSVKYSFGIPLFFQMELKPRMILTFIAIPIIAIVYWSIRFHIGLVHASLLPLQVAAVAIKSDDGVGDILMLVRSLGAPPLMADVVVLLLLVSISFLQRHYLATTDRIMLFAFYATLSLWLVYHRIYDFVFLLPAALVAIRSRFSFLRYGLIACIGYFWFATKLLDDFSVQVPILNLAVLLIIQSLVSVEIFHSSKSSGARSIENAMNSSRLT